MRKALHWMREAAIWSVCALLAAFLAITGWGQPVLAGLATVPVTSTVKDPYAKVVVSTVFFVGMVWLMVNFAEIAVLLSIVQVRSAVHVWWRYVDLARWERIEQVEYATVG